MNTRANNTAIPTILIFPHLLAYNKRIDILVVIVKNYEI